MFAILELVAAAWFGRGAVRRLGLSLSVLEECALTATAALVIAPWAMFLAAWMLGHAIGLPVACGTLALAGHLLGRGCRAKPRPDLPSTSRLSWCALTIVFGIGFHGHMLHEERDGLYTGGATYGDLALHSHLANHMATVEIDFSSPLVAGESLTYPFLGDYFVACLMRGGWSPSMAFAISGWITALVVSAWIQALALRLFRRRSAATLAVWLIMLSGSGAGIYYAIRDLATHGLPSDLGALPSYAHDRSRGLVWSNIVSDFLLPQRAFLAALPAAWAGVWAMRAAFESQERRALVVAAVAIGALPFYHVHSFLIMFGVLGLCTLWRTAIDRRAARSWWLALGVAALLAAPQIVWQFGQSWGTSFGHWRVGWLAPKGAVTWFWLRNLGVVLLLFPVAAAVAWRSGRNSFVGVLVGAAFVVFVAANLYQFQPHDWDNMKFFLYAFMFVALVLAGALAAWATRGRIAKALTAVAIAGMTTSGALTLLRELDMHTRIASKADVELARELQRVLPPNARVLTSDQHNHLVPMLTGRAIVMGYRGWLWTHGINYRGLELDVAEMFHATPYGQQLLRMYGVTHVYVGPGERKTFKAELARLRVRYPLVLKRGDVEVFDVRRVKGPIVASTGRDR